MIELSPLGNQLQHADQDPTAVRVPPDCLVWLPLRSLTAGSCQLLTEPPMIPGLQSQKSPRMSAGSCVVYCVEQKNLAAVTPVSLPTLPCRVPRRHARASRSRHASARSRGAWASHAGTRPCSARSSTRPTTTRVPERMAANVVDLAFDWFGGDAWARARGERDARVALAGRPRRDAQRTARRWRETAERAVFDGKVTWAPAGPGRLVGGDPAAQPRPRRGGAGRPRCAGASRGADARRRALRGAVRRGRRARRPARHRAAPEARQRADVDRRPDRPVQLALPRRRAAPRGEARRRGPAARSRCCSWTSTASRGSTTATATCAAAARWWRPRSGSGRGRARPTSWPASAETSSR